MDEWLLEREPPADLAEQLVCTWRGDVGEAWTPSLLGVAASEWRDARVCLDQLRGGRAARELAERVSCRDDDDGRAIELENAVRQMAAGASREGRLATAALAAGLLLRRAEQTAASARLQEPE